MRTTRFLSALVAFLLSLNAAIAADVKNDFPTAVRAWLADGSAISANDLILEGVADRYAAGTPYQGRIRINLPPKKHFLTFLTIKREALRNYNASYVCNCRAVPAVETVICDNDFFNDFLASVRQGDDAPPELNAMYQNFLANWLLGHEVGHIVLGHTSNIEKLSVRNNADSGVIWGDLREIEADNYVLTRLSHESQLQFAGFMTLSQMVTSMYADLIAEQVPEKDLEKAREDGKNPVFGTLFDVTILYNKTLHPPWFVRVLDMFYLLRKRYPQIVDSSGYWENLRARIVPREAATKRIDKWSCATPLHGPGLPPVVSDNRFLTDAELLDRLLDEGEYEIAEKRAALVRAQSRASDRSKFIDNYLDFYSAELLSHVNIKEARRVFDRAMSDFSTTASRLSSVENISIVMIRDRAAARILSSAKDLKEFISEDAKLIRKHAARASLSDRDVAYIYLNSFYIYFRSFSSFDPQSQDMAQSALQTLAKSNFAALKYAFIQRWRNYLALLPKATGTEKLAVLNANLQFFSDAIDVGAYLDATETLRDIMPKIDALPPGQEPFKAYWNDRLARLYIEFGLGEECSILATKAVSLRKHVAAYAARIMPEHLINSLEQVAIAYNQLGYCHISAQKWQDAKAPLEMALHLRQGTVSGNDVELATVEHNLAQTYVALGINKSAALKYARSALDLRTRSNTYEQLIENSRSIVASALYLNGETAQAAAVWKVWMENTRTLSDFNPDIERYYTVISGKNVNIGSMAGLAEDNETRAK